MTTRVPEQPNQQNVPPAKYEDFTANFVLGEICIVVEADRLVPADPVAPGLYQTVRTILNQWLSQNLPFAPTGPQKVPFDQDLVPTELKARFGDRHEILQPITGVGPDEVKTSPWVLLPQRSPKSTPATALLFYSIGEPLTPRAKAVQSSSAELTVQKELVRELTCYLNYHYLGLGTIKAPLPIDRINARIVAASPNWLTAALSNGGSCCGPGGVPRAAENNLPRQRLFSFAPIEPLPRYDREAAAKQQKLNAGERIPSSNVVVAVLDTSPSPKDLAAAAGRYPENWLLSDLQHFFGAVPPASPHGSFEDPLGLDSESFTTGRLNWNGAQLDPTVPDDHFAMKDHGLFVAGIIHHLAPDVPIHLIRTNTNEGRGNVWAIASVIAALPGRLLKSESQRLIVNLSQGADVPYFHLFLYRWCPKTFPSLGPPGGGFNRWLEESFIQQLPNQFRATGAQILSLIGLARKNVDAVFEWLVGPEVSNVLLVAATGNDRFLPPDGPKEPRYPAAYDFALGVASFKLDGNLADYSNASDEPGPTSPNGIVAFGGNADPPPPGDFLAGPPVITNPTDAIRGAFTSPTLPINGEINQTGWVYWVGTSFATPIVTAVAANYWADPHGGAGKPASQIMADVVQLVADARGDWVKPA